MLVNPRLETTGQPRFIYLGKPGLKVTAGFVDGSCVLQSKSFPKLLTGCSDNVGMIVSEIVKRNLTTFPFFSTKDLDFDGLKLILAHEMSFSSPCKIHLLPGTDDVVTVRSSM